MSTCLIPNESLFSAIDKKVLLFMKKFNSLIDEDQKTFKGGAFVIIPIVIGVVINLLTVNNNHYTISGNFMGISSQMKNYKNTKTLPKGSDYDVSDYKRRDQLFKLLTKGEYDDKQLTIYNSFDKPRRDQIDIQRCLYILTASYFEYKYDNDRRNDNTIKSIIFFIFSNHLHILALIAYFVKNDDTKKGRATQIIDEISEFAIQIEDVYKSDDNFSQENSSAQRSQLKIHKMKLRDKKISVQKIYKPKSLDLEENNPMKKVPYDVIPVRTNHPVTRSQTQKLRARNVGSNNKTVRIDEIPPNTDNWKPESHMLWSKEKSHGGTKRFRPRIKRSIKSKKRRDFIF